MKKYIKPEITIYPFKPEGLIATSQTPLRCNDNVNCADDGPSLSNRESHSAQKGLWE